MCTMIAVGRRCRRRMKQERIQRSQNRFCFKCAQLLPLVHLSTFISWRSCLFNHNSASDASKEPFLVEEILGDSKYGSQGTDLYAITGYIFQYFCVLLPRLAEKKEALFTHSNKILKSSSHLTQSR